MTIETPAPTTEPVAPAAPAGTTPAAGAGDPAGSAQGNAEAERIRRKMEAKEAEIEKLKAKLAERDEATKTEAEKEREKAIRDATSAVEARYVAEIARKDLESAVLLELGAKVGPDAAKALVPAVIATKDLTVEDVPGAVAGLIDRLKLTPGPGGQGGHPSAGGEGFNPWRKETWNLTKQLEMEVADMAKAKRLAAQAGIVLP